MVVWINDYREAPLVVGPAGHIAFDDQLPGYLVVICLEGVHHCGRDLQITLHLHRRTPMDLKTFAPVNSLPVHRR